MVNVHVRAAADQSGIGDEALADRARREAFQRTRALVFGAVPGLGTDRPAPTVITSPLLNRADVLAAFAEVSEKYGIDGIELRFSVQEGGALRAIFTPAASGAADRELR